MIHKRVANVSFLRIVCNGDIKQLVIPYSFEASQIVSFRLTMILIFLWWIQAVQNHKILPVLKYYFFRVCGSDAVCSVLIVIEQACGSESWEIFHLSMAYVQCCKHFEHPSLLGQLDAHRGKAWSCPHLIRDQSCPMQMSVPVISVTLSAFFRASFTVTPL